MGTLTPAAWAKSPVLHIDKAVQFKAFISSRHWHGPKDLSGEIRFLWSKKYLYVGVKVTDRIFCNTMNDGNLWDGDGPQFLVDSKRAYSGMVGCYGPLATVQ